MTGDKFHMTKETSGRKRLKTPLSYLLHSRDLKAMTRNSSPYCLARSVSHLHDVHNAQVQGGGPEWGGDKSGSVLSFGQQQYLCKTLWGCRNKWETIADGRDVETG